jgi:hypothetical protein
MGVVDLANVKFVKTSFGPYGKIVFNKGIDRKNLEDNHALFEHSGSHLIIIDITVFYSHHITFYYFAKCHLKRYCFSQNVGK